MTDAVQVAIITGLSTGGFAFAGIVFSRVWGHFENRKTNRKIDENTATTHGIAAELKPNGGSSVKDQVTETVTIVRKAASDAEAAIGLAEEAKKKQELLERDVLDLKLRFERKIVHDGKSDDLSATRLFHEAEEYLDKVDEENRHKQEQDRLMSDRDTTFE